LSSAQPHQHEGKSKRQREADQKIAQKAAAEFIHWSVSWFVVVAKVVLL
jgi:hypothetical protein